MSSLAVNQNIRRNICFLVLLAICTHTDTQKDNTDKNKSKLKHQVWNLIVESRALGTVWAKRFYYSVQVLTYTLFVLRPLDSPISF
uniref:Putative secreted protein n=1 Tax=Anopheles darlingi TaxID=43151 RepID=A0A2M4D3S1_ANODA